MTERKIFLSFKNHPHIGLFHHPLLPACARHAIQPNEYILPPHNPYVGYFHGPYKRVPNKTKHTHTQTEEDPALTIGDEVIKAYGKDYVILLNKEK